jgi:hypothetical protein
MRAIDRIARAYMETPILPANLILWRELAEQTMTMHHNLQKSTLLIPTTDPYRYRTATQVRQDVAKGELFVSTYALKHPVFTPAENLAFRFVHDVLGHSTEDADFSFLGECAAFRNHSRFFQRKFRGALFSEIVGQAACFFANGNRFGEQRPVLIEEEGR